MHYTKKTLTYVCINVQVAISKGIADSKTLLKQNHPVLNWGYQLTQVVLRDGHKDFATRLMIMHIFALTLQ